MRHTFAWMVTSILPNTVATICIPAKDQAAVMESGQPAATAAGLKFLRMDQDAAVYQAGWAVMRSPASGEVAIGAAPCDKFLGASRAGTYFQGADEKR